MTNQHPITPPPELVAMWIGFSARHHSKGSVDHFLDVANKAAQWGADQELEACAEWVGSMFHGHKTWADELRADRRPKPPTLKEQALGLLNEGPVSDLLDHEVDTIRRALEQLDD